MSPSVDDQRLDDIFGALANTTRRAILARLAQGEATVNDLAAPFSISLPTVSNHLKVLERVGLVERGRRAQFRPCRLTPGPLAEIASWTEYYRPIWEDRLDRLDQALAADRRAEHTQHDHHDVDADAPVAPADTSTSQDPR